MKERVWINIPIRYQEILCDWSKSYAYESEDEEHGKLVVYSLYTNSQEYRKLENFLEENSIPYYIFRRVYNFTKNEKDNAEILWFWIDDDAKDSYTPEPTNYVCNKCGKKVLFIDRHMLHVDYKKIKKYDIMSTYSGNIETVVSEKVREIFVRENISGVKFEPIYQLGKENKIIDGFYHLILKEGIGDVIEPSKINKKDYCPACGLYAEHICQTTLNFDRRTWDGLDICYTKNWFGGPPKFKRLIVSNKFYKVLEKNKIKNIYFQPAYFVE